MDYVPSFVIIKERWLTSQKKGPIIGDSTAEFDNRNSLHIEIGITGWLGIDSRLHCRNWLLCHQGTSAFSEDSCWHDSSPISVHTMAPRPLDLWKEPLRSWIRVVLCFCHFQTASTILSFIECLPSFEEVALCQSALNLNCTMPKNSCPSDPFSDFNVFERSTRKKFKSWVEVKICCKYRQRHSHCHLIIGWVVRWRDFSLHTTRGSWSSQLSRETLG